MQKGSLLQEAELEASPSLSHKDQRPQLHQLASNFCVSRLKSTLSPVSGNSCEESLLPKVGF